MEANRAADSNILQFPIPEGEAAFAPAFTLRPYQQAAVERVRASFLSGKHRVLVVQPTGTGKTVVFAEMARRSLEKGKRVLIIAHTSELIVQATQKIAQHCGTWADVEQGAQRAPRQANLVVASIQTLKGARLKEWAPDHFDLIIIDEAHHVIAKTYREMLAHFTGYRLVGVTATPDRGDEVNLGNVFEEIASNYPLTEAVRDGYLVRIKGRIAADFRINLKNLRLQRGDFSAHDLDVIMGEIVAPLARTIARETKGRERVLVFMPAIRSGEMLEAALRAISEKVASVNGGMPTSERDRLIDDFRQGRTRYLINCNLLIEGFDCPEIDCVVLGRPTKSRPLFTQMVGRGTRPSPGKRDLMLLNFDFESRHQLATAYDLFTDPQTGAAVRKKAEAKYVDGELVDIMEALDEAKAELFDRERILKRIRKAYRIGMESYDPLELTRMTGVDPDGELVVNFNGRPLSHKPGSASDKQKRWLWARDCRAFSWDGISMAQASLAISIIDKHGSVEAALEALKQD